MMVAFVAFGVFATAFALSVAAMWGTVVPAVPRIVEALVGERPATGVRVIRIVERRPAFRLQPAALRQQSAWREAA